MSDTAIRLISGRLFDYAEPEAGIITLHDVAHALARENRYAGHTAVTWSVAQHTLLCLYICRTYYDDKAHALACLHHDDVEMVTKDWPTPLKNYLATKGLDYKRVLERPIEWAIAKQLDLVVDDLHAGIVKQVDELAYEIESMCFKPGYERNEDIVLDVGVDEPDEDERVWLDECIDYINILLNADERAIEHGWMAMDRALRDEGAPRVA